LTVHDGDRPGDGTGVGPGVGPGGVVPPELADAEPPPPVASAVAGLNRTATTGLRLADGGALCATLRPAVGPGLADVDGAREGPPSACAGRCGATPGGAWMIAVAAIPPPAITVTIADVAALWTQGRISALLGR
jgi:hypothetical protein